MTVGALFFIFHESDPDKVKTHGEVETCLRLNCCVVVGQKGFTIICA